MLDAIFMKDSVMLCGSVYPIGHFATECCNYNFSPFLQFKDVDNLSLSSDFELFDKSILSAIEYFKSLDALISDFPLLRDTGVGELSGLIEIFEAKHVETRQEMGDEAFQAKWKLLTAEGHYPSYLSRYVDLCNLCTKIIRVIEIIHCYKASELGTLLSGQEQQEDVAAHIIELEESKPDIPLIPQLPNQTSFSVEYKIMNMQTGPRLTEVIRFSSWTDFIYMDFFRALMNGHFPKPCKNCARYFLLKPGYNYRYCDNIAPGEVSRTCRDVGASRTLTKKIKGDPILEVYERAYKKYYARKRKGTLTVDFSEWSKNAARLRDEAQAGKISPEELASRLNSI